MPFRLHDLSKRCLPILQSIKDWDFPMGGGDHGGMRANADTVRKLRVFMWWRDVTDPGLQTGQGRYIFEEDDITI